MVSTIPAKGMRRWVNAPTHPSLGALKTAGTVPAALAADLARATAGNAPASSGSKVHDCALVQSTGLAAPATRSGHASACAMGIRMSGGLAWAIVDPSVNSTME